MEIFIACTQGFCAGVATAIEIVERALQKYGTPLYVYHEIVHNTYVVNNFRSKGVVFVEDLNDVPEGQHLVLSAHGVPPATVERAQERNLKVIDASCPLVKKVHNEAIKYSEQNCETILIGHKGHQELIGTAGYVKPELLHVVENLNDIEQLDIPEGRPISYLMQTTLSVDETKGLIERLKQKFPNLVGPTKGDICYATQNRQNAVKELAQMVDLIIVCGSPNSSNSNRLRETGELVGVPSHIIDQADELDIHLLDGINKVGISSGASVPRVIVDELVEKIKSHYPDTIVRTFPDPEKNIEFKIPELE